MLPEQGTFFFLDKTCDRRLGMRLFTLCSVRGVTLYNLLGLHIRIHWNLVPTANDALVATYITWLHPTFHHKESMDNFH